MSKRFLHQIMLSPNTVFSFKGIILLWRELDQASAKSRLNYYVKQGLLYPIRRGLYAKTRDYDPDELAVKILRPSYISLETVLAREGVIFQKYNSVFLVSYKSTSIEVDGNIFKFRKIRDDILINPSGIKIVNNTSIASKERAFLDTIYLSKNYYFDNLSSINWDFCFELASIYDNKSFYKRLNKYYEEQKNA